MRDDLDLFTEILSIPEENDTTDPFYEMKFFAECIQYYFSKRLAQVISKLPAFTFFFEACFEEPTENRSLIMKMFECRDEISENMINIPFQMKLLSFIMGNDDPNEFLSELSNYSETFVNNNLRDIINLIFF